MQRLLCISVILGLSGCATYYGDGDPYSYTDRYYDRYADRYYGGPAARPYVYSAWYYDLYDPYSALFHPFGYLYDPWYWDSWHFGVHRYPSRHWSFSFYGGRPWYYSPWYGGYGLYYPYGYRVYRPAPAPVRGIPVVVQTRTPGAETAADAARGLAADVHRGNAQPLGLVRTNAVRVSAGPGMGSELLGTMAIPTERVHGLPAARSNPYAPPASAGTVPALPGAGREDATRYADRRDGEAGLPIDRAGFRGLPARTQPSSTRVYGLPSAADSSADARWDAQLIAVPVQPARPGLPGIGAVDEAGTTAHPWQDRRGHLPSARGVDRPAGLPGMGAGNAAPRSWDRPASSVPSAAPRFEPRAAPSAPRSIHGLGSGTRSERTSRDE